MGVSRFFLKVDVKRGIINKGSKLGDWDRVGVGNTGIQVIKCTLKRANNSKLQKCQNLTNATFLFDSGETNQTSLIHLPGFNRIVALMSAHLGPRTSAQHYDWT